MKCHLPQSVCLKFKNLGNIINYGPNTHFQSKPVFRIILKYPLFFKSDSYEFKFLEGVRGQLGTRGQEVREIRTISDFS